MFPFLNAFKWYLLLWWQSSIFSSSYTSAFSVTWSFRNDLIMLICCSRNISYYFLCWKQLCCCLTFLWKLWYIFQDSLMNRKFKRTVFIWNRHFVTMKKENSPILNFWAIVYIYRPLMYTYQSSDIHNTKSSVLGVMPYWLNLMIPM